MPTYMQKFDDCDNKALNPAGYAYGVEMTKQMFGRFFDKARGDLPEKFLALPAPETAVEGGQGGQGDKD